MEKFLLYRDDNIDKVFFNAQNSDGTEPVKTDIEVVEVQQTDKNVNDEDEEDIADILGMKNMQKTNAQKMTFYKYHVQNQIFTIAPTVDMSLLRIFLQYYYGLKNFVLDEREEWKCRYHIEDENIKLDDIDRAQRYKEFILYNNVFNQYCKTILPIRYLVTRFMYGYQIQNNIYENKDFFEFTSTIRSHVKVVMHGDMFKTKMSNTSRQTQDLPKLRGETLTYLLVYPKILQIQSYQGNRLYVQDIFKRNTLQHVYEGFNIPVKIEKKIYERYRIETNFEFMGKNFIDGFRFLNPQQSVNSKRFSIYLCGHRFVITQKHKIINVTAEVSDKISPLLFFTIIQNLGNYKPAEELAVSLDDLQLLDYIYFGKSHFNNYEKKLENMNRRPTVDVQENFSLNELPKFISKYIGKTPDKVVKPKTKHIRGGNKGSLTYYNENADFKPFEKKMLDQERHGLELLLSDKQNSYIFKCHRFPYLDIQIDSTGFGVFISCKSIQLKYNGIGLYDLYQAMRELCSDNDKQFVNVYLRKLLFGRVSISATQFSNFDKITMGRCCELPGDLQKVFGPNYLLLQPVVKYTDGVFIIDDEWMKSVTDDDFSFLMGYNYVDKDFEILKYNQDHSKYVIVIQTDTQLYQLLFLIENRLTENHKYMLVRNTRKIITKHMIHGQVIKFNQIQQFINTDDGLIPFYNQLVDGNIQKKMKWPTFQIMLKLGMFSLDNIYKYLVNYQEKCIGVVVLEGNTVFDQKRFYFEAMQIPKNIEKIQIQLSDYPQVINKLFGFTIWDTFYPSPKQIAAVIVTNNKKLLNDKLFEQKESIKDKLVWQETDDKNDGKFRRYGKVIFMPETKMSKTQFEQGFNFIIMTMPTSFELVKNYVQYFDFYWMANRDTHNMLQFQGLEMIGQLSQYMISQYQQKE